MTTTLNRPTPATPSAPSLVTPPQDKRTQDTRFPCPHTQLFRQYCSHGNHRWLRVPCGRWICPACGVARLHRELHPEIRRALYSAISQGLTLKFLTLTWKATDIGAEHSPSGSKRRQLDLAHLKQTLKRMQVPFDYLRAPETHRSGKIHIHMLAIVPFLHQTLWSKLWRRHSRDSFVVDVTPASYKCPRCWNPSITNRRQRRSRMITYLPQKGQAQCPTCSYVASAEEAIDATIKSALWEIGKYLVKAPAGHLSRSKAWRLFQSPKSPTNKSNGSSVTCKECNEPHVTYRYPEIDAIANHPDEYDVILQGGLGPPGPKGPCSCWPNLTFQPPPT